MSLGIGTTVSTAQAACTYTDEPVSVKVMLRDETVERISIASVVPGESPRLACLSEEHVAGLVESEGSWPPILVHRHTMQVIDGMHRLSAAMRLGMAEIDVVFFDGSAESAFVLAVESNVMHGLPLSLAERRAAAERIVELFPQWSDRAVAERVGLAPGTVGSVRSRSSAQGAQLSVRIGRDGRVRPLSTAAGRWAASRMLTARPEVSLREVARATGISPGTARDVRERLRRGEDPVLPRRGAGTSPSDEERAPTPPEPTDNGAFLDRLSKDPSLRLSESGRQLVRWLYLHALDSDDVTKLLDGVPSHCACVVAGLADGCAEAWSAIARELKKRVPD